MSDKKVKQPSLDETYVPSEDPNKLNPYDRLQALFSEKDAGKLTKNGADKLDFLLGETKEPSIFSKIFDKVKSFFDKIDGMIFAKKSRMWNTTYSKRKK